MTAGELLRIVWRRWYVVVMGLILTIWASSSLAAVERTYWVEIQLVFIQPGGASVANVSDHIIPSLVNFAGIVQRRVTETGSAVELPSSGATLYGSGIREGYSITLPNSGTQWAASYTRPVLVVQAVGHSPEAARETLDRALTAVDVAAGELQNAEGVPPESHVFIDRSPATPAVIDVGGTAIGRMKGLAALAGVGLALTASSAVGLDRMVRNRKLTLTARKQR
ncbi:hypothetical protein FJ661_14575 [Pseudarthrobacter phenanthrenivorans]|uniref:hypothetical protein n=1 Tax=Pseudarthrobacter phenanthrenivorans TaxID=361575 RepID=UPI00112EA809|nr:hypothetical protein [Pseudarthrobacter phenanthrenivorans]TPV49817.1 hypothetical protein FJ661_14575 [Pseudarthrobacter phenanthrenivorans]